MAIRTDDEILAFVQSLIVEGMSVGDIKQICVENAIGISEATIAREFDVAQKPKPLPQLRERRHRGRVQGQVDVRPRQPRSDRGQSRITDETIEQFTERAREIYGRTDSLRATARELGCSPEYVRRLLLVANSNSDGNK